MYGNKKTTCKKIYKELNNYTNIAFTIGFFTYGEFYHYKDNNSYNELLNETITTLTLSEDSSCKESNIKYLSNNNNNKTNKNCDSELIQTIDALSNLISQTSDELMQLNLNQEMIIKEEINKNKIKEKMLMQQSKLASMGDMIGMIAHQWRQPLNAISSVSASLSLKNQMNILDSKVLDSKLDDINNYVQHLSSTISDFMNFFKPNRDKEFINIKNIINSIKGIIADSFSYHNIKLIINIQDNIPPFLSYENELKQVILNLVKNSKDAIVSNQIQNGYVKIDIYKNNQFISIDIEDNGGGISNKIADKVFEPYFTTKNKDGTGIGLHMSKTIIEEHLKSVLKFKNKDNGVVFSIQLREDKNE